MTTMNIETIRLTRQIVIDQMLKDLDLWETDILEPSAGYGDLADGIKKKEPNCRIDCIELNRERHNELVSRGYWEAKCADFLKVTPTKLYDFVIATPTYKDNVDVEHIMHMYDFLKPEGKIISLTYPAWIMGESERQVRFRTWLKDKKYSMKMLEDFSFIENYKTQPSIIMEIIK